MDDFAIIFSSLTENARLSLLKADICSQMTQQDFIGTEHLLLGVLAQENSIAAKFLADYGVTLNKLKQKLGIKSQTEQTFISGGKLLNDEARLAFETGWKLAMENHQDHLGTEHLMFGLLAFHKSRSVTLMAELGVDIEQLKSDMQDFVVRQTTIKSGSKQRLTFRLNRKRIALERFGTNLTELAMRGELDPVIGRTDQVERLATILSRRTKPNPILIGEPGVGKTAVVEALAQQIVKADVPLNLIGAEIIQLDLASMVAGTKYRGEFEERLKKVIDELAADRTLIGFIDEMHLLMGAGASEGPMDAANILKPALARGQVRLIGATTYDEYRKFIQRDQALDRRFQTIDIAEPSLTETIKIIKGLRRKYENHHRMVLNDEVIEQTVFLADRYIADRFMPDKALDLLDETAASKRVQKNKLQPELKQTIFEVNKLEVALAKAVDKEEYETAANLKEQLEQLGIKLRKARTKLNKRKVANLEPADVARVVALRTGISVQQLTKSQKCLMLDLEKNLSKHIVGQKAAISGVAKAIRRSRSGVGDAHRPIGSFIFLGASGVGKTELAKVLAREVFGSDEALLKIDMSEFAERHSLSRLLGAPAGYVGYDDGAKLTDAVRRRPYQVILFDEIEKADSDVYNILLQLLEDGYLSDSRGQKVSFRNTIIILTSNLGTEQMAEQSTKRSYGFGEKAEKTVDSKKIAIEALDRFMPIELVNRFDDVVVFNTLSNDDAKKIVDLMLSELKKRLSSRKIQLEVSNSAKKMLVQKGFDHKKGARLLRRVIEEEIENRLSEAILMDQLKAGDIAKVSFRRGKVEVKAHATVS